ncbi:MAG: ferrous iron transport protein B [Bacteroidales bacterium]|jgi:ferrous iron transport protein B|nr:ferrous iron transport protein B [Bacteroidales bacterium]MCI2145159.1 ferrous iron transport protein B [Bacteroidales bacterium]
MKLSDLQTGESAIIIKVSGHGGFRKRILEMGFVAGQKVKVLLNAPFKDPVKYEIMGYEVSLRRNEASMIDIITEKEAESQLERSHAEGTSRFETIEDVISHKRNIIDVALVGNPNSGKTSLFNVISGGHEHVGNYSGVTVDAKTGSLQYKGYTFNFTDLPGTYSLSAYTPEEIYVRRHIFNKSPDVILNVTVASNLERNLFLTTELIDINPKMVVALNMYDELERSGTKLDYDQLGKMIGVPMVPVIARCGHGIRKLLNTIIAVYENRDPRVRHVHITHSSAIENEISNLSKPMHECTGLPHQFPPRYWAMKMLEQDEEVESILKKLPEYPSWAAIRDKGIERIKKTLGEDVESAITSEKYGFIDGALKETLIPGPNDVNKPTRLIDKLVTNKWLGFPIFILLMYIMFWCTFELGKYPQNWLGWCVQKLGGWVSAIMQPGPLKDLIVNGIIGGVGSVIVFLPNILILYLFISLMEDSGYMARAAFIMDKLMHGIGLHGKSFIPLLMGFGCNVPSIMATRTIESRSSRLITILINPFMSCSARLPVYVLLTAAFFPKHAALVMIGLYALGGLVAVLTAKLLRKTAFSKEETPFVMELPPYRVPTFHATMNHMWEKCKQYLKKIGGVILIASVIVWFLSYYPHKKPSSPNGTVVAEQQYEQSYLGRIGKFLEPTMKPLGLDWRASVALLSGMPAKEIIVSTMGVLYQDSSSSEAKPLSVRLRESGAMTPRSALALLVFILLYFPCIATLATIANETGHWYFAAGSAVYNTLVAWLFAFATYNIYSSQNWQVAVLVIIAILVVLQVIKRIIRRRKSPCLGCPSAGNCSYLEGNGHIDPNSREWMMHRRRYGQGNGNCPRAGKRMDHGRSN